MVKYEGKWASLYRDIPQFTSTASYQCDVSWEYLESHLKSWEEGYELTMEPDFQRAHVWTREQQIKYVEYVLRGGYSAKDIYWNAKGWMRMKNVGPLELVDGKQRLTAVLHFLGGLIPAFGHSREEYTGRMDILTTRFKFHVNDLKTRAEVLQWYIDLNDGGVAHTSEEIKKVKKLLAKEKGE